MRRFGAWVVALALLLPVGTAAAKGELSVAVELQPGPRSAQLGPRFQPISSSVSLKAGGGAPGGGSDHRGGTLPFGPAGSAPRRFVVARTKAGEAYDQLVIDLNGDGSLDDETPLPARMQSSGQTIWSTWNFVVKVDHGAKGKPQIEDHPFRAYIAVSSKTARPDSFNYTSQGFRFGRVTIVEKLYDIVLTDRNNDARYGPGDAWTIQSASAGGRPEMGEAHDVKDIASAGSRRWQLVLRGTGGRHAVVAEPGAAIGAAPAAAPPASGAHAEDRALPRSESPLAFVDTVEAARAAAAKIAGAWFLSFESDGNADSRSMREIVYTAKAATDGAGGLSCARIDADASKDLVAAHNVKKVPTGILFDPEGKEVARFEGYLSVENFGLFLGAVNPWLEPADVEPDIRGKNRSRHRGVVKKRIAYLEDNKHQGLLVDRVKDLGLQKNRAARDALMKFATGRKSKEYVTAAFFALAKIGGKTAIEFLCSSRALNSKDFLVAQQAAHALGAAMDARGVDALLGVLGKRGTKIEVLSASCLALARSAPQDERVIKAVFEHSKHAKDTVRAGAAEALGYLKSAEGLERLKVMLTSDANTRVRAAAALGIGHTMHAELIPVLRKAIADDKAHTVRTSALAAIRELQGEKQDTVRR